MEPWFFPVHLCEYSIVHGKLLYTNDDQNRLFAFFYYIWDTSRFPKELCHSAEADSMSPSTNDA